MSISSSLTELENRTVALPFRWRDKTGNFHPIDKMNTHHLFNTFRMIWNHSMREEGRSRSYTHYSFGKFYTPAYMRDAVRHIAPELLKREDIAPAHLMELNYFIDYLRRKTKLLEASHVL